MGKPDSSRSIAQYGQGERRVAPGGGGGSGTGRRQSKPILRLCGGGEKEKVLGGGVSRPIDHSNAMYFGNLSEPVPRDSGLQAKDAASAPANGAGEGAGSAGKTAVKKSTLPAPQKRKRVRNQNDNISQSLFVLEPGIKRQRRPLVRLCGGGEKEKVLSGQSQPIGAGAHANHFSHLNTSSTSPRRKGAEIMSAKGKNGATTAAKATASVTATAAAAAAAAAGAIGASNGTMNRATPPAIRRGSKQNANQKRKDGIQRLAKRSKAKSSAVGSAPATTATTAPATTAASKSVAQQNVASKSVAKQNVKATARRTPVSKDNAGKKAVVDAPAPVDEGPVMRVPLAAMIVLHKAVVEEVIDNGDLGHLFLREKTGAGRSENYGDSLPRLAWRLVEELGLRASDRLADIGSGNGTFACALSLATCRDGDRRGARVDCIECRPDRVEVARKVLRAMRRRLDEKEVAGGGWMKFPRPTVYHVCGVYGASLGASLIPNGVASARAHRSVDAPKGSTTVTVHRSTRMVFCNNLVFGDDVMLNIVTVLMNTLQTGAYLVLSSSLGLRSSRASSTSRATGSTSSMAQTYFNQVRVIQLENDHGPRWFSWTDQGGKLFVYERNGVQYTKA